MAELKLILCGFSIAIILISNRILQNIDQNLCSINAFSIAQNEIYSGAYFSGLTCSPYFHGLRALANAQVSDAENYFESSFTTIYSPFARSHLLIMWANQGKWQQVQRYLQSSEPIDSTF